MIIDRSLHQTFINQTNSMIINLFRCIDDQNIHPNNAYEFQKQFLELKQAILKVEQYSEVYPLLEINAELPDKSNYNVIRFLAGSLSGRRAEKKTEKMYIYFNEVCEKLKSVLFQLKRIQVD